MTDASKLMGGNRHGTSAEKQKRLITQRTLHAVVNDAESIANNQSSANSIPNCSEDVKDSDVKARILPDESDFRQSLKLNPVITEGQLDFLDSRRAFITKRELTELKKINEELRAQIRLPGVKHIVSQLGVQKVARHLKSEYMSKINIHKLAGELGDFYTLIANGDGISRDTAQIQKPIGKFNSRRVFNLFTT